MTQSTPTFIEPSMVQSTFFESLDTDGREFYANIFASLRSSNRQWLALALYRCGKNIATDYGWAHYSGNLADSYEELKEDGCNGYSLFRAKYLYDDYAADELGFLNEALGE